MQQEIVTRCRFIDRANALVGCDLLEPVSCDAHLTCGEAAQLICRLLHISEQTISDAAGDYMKVLADYDLIPEGAALEADQLLGADTAERWLIRATRAKIVVNEGSGMVVRETVSLDMGAPARRIGGRLYVPISFAELGLGGYSEGEAPYAIVVNNRCFDDQSCFAVENDGVVVSLTEICAFFGAEQIVTNGSSVTALFDRALLKSNRDLSDSERRRPYSKLYYRYWYTPLPERRDEIVWRGKSCKFCREENALPNNTLLHPTQIEKLLDPDFCDPEGWCRFDDGTAALSVITPMPGVTAEMFYWWFAWHGLEDLRYMVWFPPSHFGIWLENMPGHEDEPFRPLNEALSFRERTYHLLHHNCEEMGSSVSGRKTYFRDQTDGTNTMVIRPKGTGGLAFVDVSGPQGYFDPAEYNAQSDAGVIAAVGQYPPSPEFGAIMCHFFRIGKDGTPALHTHFWFGCTFDRVTHEFLLSKTMAYRPMLVNLSEHSVREFATLADVLPEIWEMEKGIPFEKFAQREYYRKGVHPNI